MPSLTLAGLLYLGAAGAVVPVVLLRRQRSAEQLPAHRHGRADIGPLTLAVIFGGALGPVFLVAGLARTSAATASLLLNFELVATAILAATIFREHLGRRLWFAAALIAGAGVVLVWQPGAALDAGGLFILAACICWGVDNSVTARIDQLTPEQVVLAKGIVAGGANLALGLTLRGTSGLTLGDTVTALLIGALGYGLSITLWVKGARDLGAARGQVIFSAAPFIGVVIAWIALGDALTVAQLIAVPLAAAGVVLSLGSEHLHLHSHTALSHEHDHSHDDGHHEHDHNPAVSGRHTHRHDHTAVSHAHPHVPDLHHRHDH